MTYLSHRPRRLRTTAAMRDLVAETQLSSSDLIWPVFVADKPELAGDVTSMPGVSRLVIDDLKRRLDQLCSQGLKALALFPVVASDLKSEKAEESFNPQGLVPEVVADLKKSFPDLLLVTDVALDPYTSHGQDGLVDEAGQILNDETVAVLTKQALCQAQAGVDIVAPSDMMDGRVGAIREAFEESGFSSTKILAYSAKYASSFYGPFRDAVGSAANLGRGGKETYQMNPANSNEALLEVGLDLEEGADMVMVKPGLPYLDIVRRVKDQFQVPTFVYHVSGEYAMVKAAGQNGWIDEKKVVLESLLSCKRAGADAVLTYFTPDVLGWL